jgi:hypothetical protein
MELEDAKKRIQANGRNPDDFAFEMEMMPPDPDGGGMFTVRYEIEITDKTTSKSLGTIGGIGLDWVGHFEEALKDGHFA